MLSILLFAALVSADPRIESLWSQGKDYAAFHESVDARKRMWNTNTKAAEDLPRDVVARAKAVSGTWRLLVVAVDRCSDSASSVPFIASLAKAANIELRVISPEQGKWLQEKYRTPDGRAATPTVILVDAGYRDVAAWMWDPLESTCRHASLSIL